MRRRAGGAEAGSLRFRRLQIRDDLLHGDVVAGIVGHADGTGARRGGKRIEVGLQRTQLRAERIVLVDQLLGLGGRVAQGGARIPGGLGDLGDVGRDSGKLLALGSIDPQPQAELDVSAHIVVSRGYQVSSTLRSMILSPLNTLLRSRFLMSNSPSVAGIAA
ncbi:MAG: hypothetical protein PHY45_11675 [Rhodocyclaceae bacterium]|nr:hypothetical protein [Rhodocyclaceae bacterium]